MLNRIKNYNEYEQILENLSQARAILRLKNIDENNENYQKIISKTNKDGYTGILTKLHFKEGVDIQEVLDLHDDLKKNNINVADITKLEYGDIVDLVYKEEDDNKSQLCFKYKNYYVFYVKTYEAGLDICSPAWCLKTRSMWDKYNNYNDGYQFVIVEETAVKNNRLLLSTPNTYYGEKYTNTKKPQIRYGLTMYRSGNFEYFDDNNNTMHEKPQILLELKPLILEWLEKNNLLNKKVILNDYTDFRETLIDALKNINNDQSFDIYVYKQDKNYYNTVMSELSTELNMSVDEIISLFIKYKKEMLSDHNISSCSGVMDILLYNIFGEKSVDLSGILLNERDVSDYSYKYTYGFHKYYWGRKLIEQSYGSVSEWMKKLAHNFDALMGVGVDYHIGSFVYDYDFQNITKEQISQFYTVKDVENGAIVYFKIDKFSNKFIEQSVDDDFIADIMNFFKSSKYENGILTIEFIDKYDNRE